MLHPVPNSEHRATLLRVVDLQLRLVAGLCATDEGTNVDLPWLQNIWRGCDEQWIRRFWENDHERRAQWIKNVAAASVSDKEDIWNLVGEQMYFPELYNHPPTLRLSQRQWRREPLASLRCLLISFYDPYFYAKEGYGEPCAVDGQKFNKDIFLAGFPNRGPYVCPYCDNTARRWELDHFLPKDDFPALSCHPDNLIPSCHECNSITQKGTGVPLSLSKPNQAADWFHPRYNSAKDRISVTFAENRNHVLKMHLIPAKTEDNKRVFRLNQLFGLSRFWGRSVNPDIQLISGDIAVLLQDEPRPLSEESVRRKLLQQATVWSNHVGTWSLAISQSSLYRFVADNQALVRDILRECKAEGALNNGAAKQNNT